MYSYFFTAPGRYPCNNPWTNQQLSYITPDRVDSKVALVPPRPHGQEVSGGGDVLRLFGDIYLTCRQNPMSSIRLKVWISKFSLFAMLDFDVGSDYKIGFRSSKNRIMEDFRSLRPKGAVLSNWAQPASSRSERSIQRYRRYNNFISCFFRPSPKGS